MLKKDEVQHIARLARIGITAEEETRFQKELTGVFGLIEELREAQVEELRETDLLPRETNQTREDRAEESGMSAAIQKNFPQSKDGFNKVRAVF